jgi:cobalt/nickel transport system ATP-binding protein
VTSAQRRTDADVATPAAEAVGSGIAPALELRDVSYVYAGGVAALREVSFAVAHGERLALLGANGSGKSTLLRVMAGLVAPGGGEVRAFGAPLTAAVLRDEAAAHAFRRRVGIVFQSADAQLFNPTVRDEVGFGPLHLDLSRDELLARVDDTLRMLGLSDLADRAPYHLSGGEKKKVALAAVLAINPEVLLFDEPTGGLDPRTQEWLVQLLQRLHAVGKTIVLATHHLEQLDRLADRVVILGEDHAVAADGPISDLLTDRALLVRVNLIHEHAHYHGVLLHSHPHSHTADDRHGGAAPPAHDHEHRL